MSEYVQFAVMMALFVAILAGSYYFVLTSPGAPKDQQHSGGSSDGEDD